MSHDHEHQHTLPPEERLRVRAQVDHFVEVLEARYGITVHEVLEAVRWAQDAKKTREKLSQAGAVSLIGLIVTAMAMALVEGIKTWVGGHK